MMCKPHRRPIDALTRSHFIESFYQVVKESTASFLQHFSLSEKQQKHVINVNPDEGNPMTTRNLFYFLDKIGFNYALCFYLNGNNTTVFSLLFMDVKIQGIGGKVEKKQEIKILAT